jgi:hypothetical protein
MAETGWEWRVFGELVPTLRDRIMKLPKKFEDPQELTDRYLWSLGCSINVKLRKGDLKVKHLIRSRNDVEEWQAQTYPFPLPPDVVKQLLVAFRLDLQETPIKGETQLLDFLRRDSPAIRIVTVEKKRWQHLWSEKDKVTVEVAEISTPEKVTSVCVENPDGTKVTRAIDDLGLRSGQLKVLNYLRAIEVWGHGEKLM